MIWKMGVNTALRVSDLFTLRVHQVKWKFLGMNEQKTRKFRRVYINETFQPLLLNYIKHMNDDDYLFRTMKDNSKPSYSAFYANLKKAADFIGCSVNIGTHTMRKTFGYHYYRKFRDIALLMEILNHTHQRETLIYIGVMQEEIDKTIEQFYI